MQRRNKEIDPRCDKASISKTYNEKNEQKSKRNYDFLIKFNFFEN